MEQAVHLPMKLFNKLSLIIKSFEKNLPENKIYVLPTWTGIKILILFVVLVVLGLIYTNNYIIFLAFFVFFFLLLSIFLTYENFKPLCGVKILLNNCFAKETYRGKIIFQTNQNQVSFGLSCLSSNKLVHLTSNEYKKSFSGQDQFIDIMAVQRGYYEKLRLKIESTFPFN